jgi:hypothetical protein
VIIGPAPDGFSGAKSLDVEDLSGIVRRTIAQDGKHVLLDDPQGRHRIWFAEETPASRHAFIIPIDDDFAARLEGVRRLHRRLTARPTGPPLRSLRLSTEQRGRLTLLVRALDGQQSGATRREIATVLLDGEARDIPAIEWKSAPLRKRINRIVSRARSLMNGGYLALLRGDPERATRFRRSP